MRVAKIHDFIKELINEDEIVSNRLLFELLEILAENGDQLVEEGEDEGRVGIGLGHRQQDQIVVFDENESDVTVNWKKEI